MEVNWKNCAKDFEPEGSLRDIYAHSTRAKDWPNILDFLDSYSELVYVVDGEELQKKPEISEIIKTHEEKSWAVRCIKDKVNICGHFFPGEELMFTVDPREIDINSFAIVLDFIVGLAKAAKDWVVLTPEGWEQTTIISCDPSNGQLDYHPHEQNS